MQITAIEPRRKSLSALFIDGEFVMNLDTETLIKSGYRMGAEITDEQLYELTKASDSRRANEKALYLLEHRSHSKKELVDKIKRTASIEAAEAAANRMEELGLVNDEEYARNFAFQLLNRKGYSTARTLRELELKGINKDIASEIIDELAPNPVEKIKEIIEKKYDRYLGDEKGRRRTINALQRLGYRFDDIRTALKEYDFELTEE